MSDALSDAVDAAEAGEDHVITRHGEPVAVLVGYARYEELVNALDQESHRMLSSVYTRTPENQDRVARGARQCGCNECSSWLLRNGYGPVSGDQEGTSG